jgi:hypothetical protein
MPSHGVVRQPPLRDGLPEPEREQGDPGPAGDGRDPLQHADQMRNVTTNATGPTTPHVKSARF